MAVQPPTIERKILPKNFDIGRANGNSCFALMHTPAGVVNTLFYIFQNRQASTHFYVRLDGVVEQYVELENTAWHMEHQWWNSKSVGIEHAEKVTNGWWDSVRTPELYEASARLIAWLREINYLPDITEHWIRRDRDIRAEEHMPAKDCPGGLDIGRIINRANEIFINEHEDMAQIQALQTQVSQLTSQIGILEQDKIDLQEVSKELNDKNLILEGQHATDTQLISDLQKEVQAYMKNLSNYDDFSKSWIYQIYLLLTKKNGQDKGTSSKA